MYTINGKQYSEFDINNRCAELMRVNVRVAYGELRIGLGQEYDPIKLPHQAWPIIEKCWDELNAYVDFDGGDDPYHDEKFGTRWEWLIKEHNCTKLTAACIGLIEMAGE